MSTNPYSQHMSAAITAARAASRVLMKRFNTGVHGIESWEKSPGALVTEADIESDRAIADALEKSGCGGAIISEESNVDLGGQSDSGDNVEWLVDPLCGTVPFSTGMSHWGVNIAMRAEGELTLSALAVPTSDTLVTASTSDGVKVNDQEWTASFPQRDLGEVAVGLEIDGQEQWRHLLESGGLNWLTCVGQANGFSSAAYPLTLVATNRMAAVVFYRIEPMHLAAGALAATLLGANATDGKGNEIDWSLDDELPIVVIGWPHIHDQLIEAINL